MFQSVLLKHYRSKIFVCSKPALACGRCWTHLRHMFSRCSRVFQAGTAVEHECFWNTGTKIFRLQIVKIHVLWRSTCLILVLTDLRPYNVKYLVLDESVLTRFRCSPSTFTRLSRFRFSSSATHLSTAHEWRRNTDYDTCLGLVYALCRTFCDARNFVRGRSYNVSYFMRDKTTSFVWRRLRGKCQFLGTVAANCNLEEKFNGFEEPR